MIPEFLRNRKTYMLTALVFTIIGVLSLSFAFFQFADDTDLTSSNTIMVETTNINDITKTFTVTYEGNDGLIKTGSINDEYNNIYKFKVTNDYDESYPIGINWDLVKSTVTQTNTNYTLYTCTEANYTSATIDNVASLCTAISPSTDNYLPKTNEMHKLTSANEIILDANETEYYIVKIVINNTESGKSFNGAIRVKHRVSRILTLNLNDGEITCDTVMDLKLGDTVILPIPIKTGYVFEGWSIGEVDSVINHYTFTMGSMDTTLTASWTAKVQTFLYSGNVQIFTAPQTGTYQVEAWGASGGKGYYNSTGGVYGNQTYGAYTKGEIYLEKNESLYVYVGGAGGGGGKGIGGTAGWNGGGTGGYYTNMNGAGGGGGATDFRYFSSLPSSDDLIWNSTIGLNSRIMVAGGSGGVFSSGYNGGGIGLFYNDVQYGTQTVGASFGIGASGSSTSNMDYGSNGGGGGGYYGGKTGGYISGGGGGSSYISGHVGSNSILSINSRIPTGNAIHFSNKYFLNTLMIDGDGNSWTNIIDELVLMPNPNGGDYPIGSGHVGNGYAKVSFINYLEKDNIEITNEKTSINNQKEYQYSGNYQIFIAEYDGIYELESWGAAGGIAYYKSENGNVGRQTYGGYAKGEIYMKSGEKLYIYVGGRGKNGQQGVGGAGGFNGGGTGGYYPGLNGAGGGGGATDIRFFENNPTSIDLAVGNYTGLNSRIMVAGGGAGVWGSGGNGGGLNGYSSSGIGGTQTMGYSFGIGGNGVASSSSMVIGTDGGGGGGYFGGNAGYTYCGGGGGGSSYISGHIGSNSILSESNRVLTGNAVHYSNKFFLNTLMIDGSGNSWGATVSEQVQMPSYYSTFFSLGTGNVGNGFVRIIRKSIITKSNSVLDVERSNLNHDFYYDYSGTYQLLTVPKTGNYSVELWGASGGQAFYYNNGVYGVKGKGAYTKGVIHLNKLDKLYIYVGGKGGQGGVGIGGSAGYNGGGKGGYYLNMHGAGGGGGATDIRFFNNTPTTDNLIWNNYVGLNNRIMVAAGGGGAWNNGGNAGGLVGYNGGGTIATQISGYNFGLGGSGVVNNSSSTPTAGLNGGGGGGYYGGGAGSSYGNSGSGGSSYISGHNGSVAISDLSSSISPRPYDSSCLTGIDDITCSYHLNLLSNNSFTNTIMIDGSGFGWKYEKETFASQMPNPSGGNYAINSGHEGNGYARVLLLS